ncbi:MAG: 6,7-dimethyl-8-ribityllumazine synthase [Cellvibrionaceae bacterium]
MNQSANRRVSDTLPKSSRIAFIQSCWNKEIVDQCRDSFLSCIKDRGLPVSHVDCFEVPGALEIPLQAKLLSKTGRYDIIVTTGLVVDGGIYRHEFVADAILKGFMETQLETDIPIISAVLTPHHFHDGKEHHDYFFNHFKVKGVEAANACVSTLQNIELIREL